MVVGTHAWLSHARVLHRLLNHTKVLQLLLDSRSWHGS
jgi:hypothetical protein